MDKYNVMTKSDALIAFIALSQATRLDVFRLLIKAGENGMMAGDISQALAIKQNTMSANLSILARTNLVKKKREGRHIRYTANFAGVRALLQFLMEDCCGGEEKKCGEVLDAIVCG